MLIGFPPYIDDNPFGIYEKILAGRLEFPYIPGLTISHAAEGFICGLLANDRTQRLGNLKGGAMDVKRHIFFRSTDWDAVYHRSGYVNFSFLFF